jgi:hypothetical protein
MAAGVYIVQQAPNRTGRCPVLKITDAESGEFALLMARFPI